MTATGVLRKLSHKPRKQRFTDWLIRLTAAGVFFAIGLDKFHARSEWLDIFARIGFGQWFRFATGIIEALGGFLILIPRTTTIGAGLLACAMLGAIAAHLFLLGDPLASVIPATLLGVIVAIALKLNSEPDELSRLDL